MARYYDPNDPTYEPYQGRGVDASGATAATESTDATDETVSMPSDWRTWFMEIMGGLPATPTNLYSKKADLEKYGVKVIANASGVYGKIKLPGGEIIDVIPNAASGGGGAWSWQTGGDSSASTKDTPITVDESYLEPWTKEFSFSDFSEPTESSVLADPSYQFRLNQSIGSLENSAAARGVLNSGGTLYDITNTAGQLASQEYSNVRDRAYNAWKERRDQAWQNFVEEKNTHYLNQSNPWAKLYQAASLGSAAATA